MDPACGWHTQELRNRTLMRLAFGVPQQNVGLAGARPQARHAPIP